MRKLGTFSLITSILVGACFAVSAESICTLSNASATLIDRMPTVSRDSRGSCMVYEARLKGKSHQFLLLKGTVNVKWEKDDDSQALTGTNIYLKGPLGNIENEEIEPLGQIDNLGLYRDWINVDFNREQYGKKNVKKFELPTLVFGVPKGVKEVTLFFQGKLHKIKTKQGQNPTFNVDTVADFKIKLHKTDIPELRNGLQTTGVTIGHWGRALSGRLIRLNITVRPKGKKRFWLDTKDFSAETDSGQLIASTGYTLFNSDKCFSEEGDHDFQYDKGHIETKTLEIVFLVAKNVHKLKVKCFGQDIGSVLIK